MEYEDLLKEVMIKFEVENNETHELQDLLQDVLIEFEPKNYQTIVLSRFTRKFI